MEGGGCSLKRLEQVVVAGVELVFEVGVALIYQYVFQPSLRVVVVARLLSRLVLRSLGPLVVGVKLWKVGGAPLGRVEGVMLHVHGANEWGVLLFSPRPRKGQALDRRRSVVQVPASVLRGFKSAQVFVILKQTLHLRVLATLPVLVLFLKGRVVLNEVRELGHL